MNKKLRQIRVDDDEWERWQKAADEWGVTRSEWIRRKCNAEEVEVAGEVYAGPVVPRKEANEVGLENPVAVATRPGRKEKLGPEYFSICPHNLVKAGCPRCKGR